MSADPWVTRSGDKYYYSEAGCKSGENICVRVARHLAELAATVPAVVWTSPGPHASNGAQLWAPEIHWVGKRWYIYYAADPDGNNERHRLFVLESKTEDAMGPYREADTGWPHGELRFPGDHWGIDPNLFTAADGKLYLTWSCTDFADSRFPQRICLAPMRDALHAGGAAVAISTPNQPWEKRGKPIQEGPVGYSRHGRTFITYSGSSSWIPDDYAVGLLEHSSGDLMNAAGWTKSGPVFDHHDRVYGPGSVVFIADRGQFWNMYHAIERLDCKPAYSCRDVRMQPMFFDAAGAPVLGYPYDPGVAVNIAAREAEWGDAWGDAAEGSSAGSQSGNWRVEIDSVALREGTAEWSRIFRSVNPNRENYRAYADVRLENRRGQYGIYCLYDDARNHAEVLIDAERRTLLTHAIVKGSDTEWQSTRLAAGFDPAQFHRVECEKRDEQFKIRLDGLAVERRWKLRDGQMGVLARGGAQPVYRRAGMD